MAGAMLLTGLGAIVSSSAATAAADLAAFRLGAAPAISAGSALVGVLPASDPLSLVVVLEPRDPAGLSSMATAVSTPGNPAYHQYLAPGAFAGRFGASPATIDDVRSVLRGEGLVVGATASDGLSLSVSGTAASVGAAFHTGFDLYRVAEGGEAYANTVAPLLPGSLTGQVQAVLGLDSLARMTPLDLPARPPAARPSPRPAGPTVPGEQQCGGATAAADDWGGYTASQIASAYGFTPLYNAGDFGHGVTVALYELEGNQPSDIAAFQSCYGTSASVTYQSLTGTPLTSSTTIETSLDIETIIGLAPQANIIVYQAPDPSGAPPDPSPADDAYLNLQAIMRDDTAQVVSISWDWGCEPGQADAANAAAENTLFEQAATQGQSVFAASGDSGSSGCNPDTNAPGANSTTQLAVQDPGSQPYLTSVGGTSLQAVGPRPTETTWNWSTFSQPQAAGGGGGISSFHAMPAYQIDAGKAPTNVINANSSGTPCGAAAGSYCRQVPDVSADADQATGYAVELGSTVCSSTVSPLTSPWCVEGGTSFAAPLWAAMTAVIDSSASCTSPVGFANPKLYVAATTSYAQDFNDVTTGNNDAADANHGLYPAGPGYDMATGLGTPYAAGLAASLCASISSVTFAGPVTSPTVTVGGTGFGASAPSTANAACGSSASGVGDDYASALYFTDTTKGWNAGQNVPGESGCDGIGLVVSSYSNTQIVFKFGSVYSSYPSVSPGHTYQLNVLGTSFTGTVAYATVTGISFSGSYASPLITVTGTALGSSAVLGQGQDPCGPKGGSAGYDFGATLGLSDLTQGWNAGQGCDGIGLIVTGYTSTGFSVQFGSAYSGYHNMVNGDQIHFNLLGVTYVVTVSYVPSQVSTGWADSCVLDGGSVDCWGQNVYGQLGNGSTTDAHTPVAVQGLTTATQVAAGGFFSCALLSAGTVDCWGINTSGQLGNGTTTSSDVPVAVSGLSGVSQIAAGKNFACALLTSHAVRCWGNNQHGELGNNSTANADVPVAVNTIVTATQISLGGAHSCAVLMSLNVECWGYNNSGQLGNGGTDDAHVPTLVSIISTATHVAAGYSSTCADVGGAIVKCWGDNGNGQLGLGNTTDSPVPVAIPNLTATQVAEGGDMACAVITTPSGTVQCWGANNSGQLGIGSTAQKTSPTTVTVQVGTHEVAAGNAHVCELAWSGEVWCWGLNTDGQLGDGSTANSSVPVQVTGI